MNEKILHKLSYGLYVVGGVSDGRFNGQIANTVFQLTSEPLTVGICLNHNNLTNEFVKKGKVFSIAVLPKSTPLSLIGHFGFQSGRTVNKYEKVPFKQGITGAPLLVEQTIGYLEAEVINQVEVSTHTLFVGKVIAGEVLQDEEPMTYALYHQLKQGLKPAVAPVSSPQGLSSKAGNSYKCSICGYEYIPGETSFEELPAEWVCPICGAAKQQFRAI